MTQNVAINYVVYKEQGIREVFQNFFSTEAFGTKPNTPRLIPLDDKLALEVFERTIKKTAGGCEIGFPGDHQDKCWRVTQRKSKSSSWCKEADCYDKGPQKDTQAKLMVFYRRDAPELWRTKSWKRSRQKTDEKPLTPQ